MTSIGFTRLMSVTGSTKRLPAADVNGIVGSPVTNIASLTCTPLDPVDREMLTRLAIDTPYEVLQTFTEETDITEGDILVVSSVDYPVKAVSTWADFRGDTFLHVVVEDLKAS